MKINHTEKERLHALIDLKILDTSPEKNLDDITLLAAQICKTPIALISLIDENRQWFKSRIGIEATETSLEISFCTHAIQEDKIFIVEDALNDNRFDKNPLVINDPKIRFYAGVQLTTSEGFNIGTLCVIDQSPKKLLDYQVHSLEVLARQVVVNFENNNLKNKSIERETFFSSIISMLPDLVSYIDTNLKYKYINPTYEQWFKLSPHQVLEKDMREVLGEFAFNLAKPFIDKALQGETQEFELELPYNIDGETVYKIIQAHYIPDKNNDGQVKGFYAVVEDITDIRNKEMALKNAEAKLLSSAKMASLGEMAGNIAHEINNPLAIIMAKSEWMIDNITNEKIERENLSADLNSVVKTCDRIAKIVAGLRSFSRNSEQDPTNIVPVSKILEETLSLCKERFKKNGVDLNINCPREITVECRPTQISQILMNLLNNAFDAIIQLENKWINVEVFEVNNELTIKVTDCGNGIDKDTVEKMMNPFFTTKAVEKGTGLGLSISKGIAESNHGKLFYDASSVNTCFVLKLPVRQTALINSSKN